jgi:uncharacterized membrane protein YeaQ/YmgE (transglycosylase-associated protein family)
MGILSWIIVGAIAGWLAGMLVRGDEGLGIIGHIVLGIVGAIVGGFIVGALTGGDYVTGINITTIVVAAIGAVIVVITPGGRPRTARRPSRDRPAGRLRDEGPLRIGGARGTFPGPPGVGARPGQGVALCHAGATVLQRRWKVIGTSRHPRRPSLGSPRAEREARRWRST